ncbi:MAG: maleylpyruvate isomerase N-terminal domain-containing protein [Actinomycetota bacterium]|nr:maleylpyruvate isomerase N-terminal domain-containing protein [Actinomycetota bacterium]
MKELFLELAGIAAHILAGDDVRSRWNDPSALRGYQVGGLAGHLVRAVLTVESYLDAPEPAEDRELSTAVDYFAAVLGADDPVDSEFHAAVRRRGAEAAADGPEVLLASLQSATARLSARLRETDTAQRRVVVLQDLTLTLDEYLRTRVVELLIHLDDLAASLGHPFPDVPDSVFRVVAGLLGELASIRAGGLETVRSLARAERHPQPVRAL